MLLLLLQEGVKTVLEGGGGGDGKPLLLRLLLRTHTHTRTNTHTRTHARARARTHARTRATNARARAFVDWELPVLPGALGARSTVLAPDRSLLERLNCVFAAPAAGCLTGAFFEAPQSMPAG